MQYAEHEFVPSPKAQEVVDLEHLQQLLDAGVALLYKPSVHDVVEQTGRIGAGETGHDDLQQGFLP